MPSYPSFNSAGTLVAQTSTNSIVVGYPSGSTGDIIIFFGYGIGSTYTTATGFESIISTPSGPVTYIGWKRATSTSSGTTTYAYASGSNTLKGVCYRFGGCVGSIYPAHEVYPEWEVNYTSSGWVVNIPSIVVGGTYRLLCALTIVDDVKLTLSDDATYYAKGNAQYTGVGGDTTHALYTYGRTSSGTAPADTYSISALSSSKTYVLKLIPDSYSNLVNRVSPTILRRVNSVEDVSIGKVNGA